MAKMDMNKLAASMAGRVNPAQVAKFGVNYASNPLFRMGVNAGVTGSLGVAASAFDKEDDTVMSALGKGAKAAALEFFIEEAIIMGAQTQLATRGLPGFLTKPITEKLGLGSRGEKLLTNSVNGFIKNKVNLPKGKFLAGGIGAGVGVAWTMMNHDSEGVIGTLGNMAAGAGLGLMGKEIYEHLAKEKNNPKATPRNFYKQKIADFTATKHGQLIKSNINNFMDSSAGKIVGTNVLNVLNSPHGKVVAEQIDNILDGKLGKVLTADVTKLQDSLVKVQDDINSIFNDPKLAKELKKYPNSPQGKAANKELAKYIQGYVNSIGQNVENASANVAKIANQYKNDPKLLEKHMREFMEGNAEEFSKVVKQMGGNIDVQSIQKNLEEVSNEFKRFQGALNKNPAYTVGDMMEEVLTSAENLEEKGFKVGHFSQAQTRVEAEKVLDKNVEAKKIKNNLGKMKVAGAIGLTAFAAASVIDSNKENQQEVRAGRMKAEQEKNLTRQKSREKEVMSQFQYGGPTDFGSIAFDMFNQRIGHHLMGNAKFQ
jgi:hypothetical protein